jgi:hypothetical protein
MTGGKKALFISAVVAFALQATPCLAADCDTFGTVALEANGLPRREVMERLLADRGINLEWSDKSVADQPIKGVFKGDFDRVLRMVLSGTNWLAAYDGEEGCRISKILVLGAAAQAAPIVPRVDLAKEGTTTTPQTSASSPRMTTRTRPPAPPSTRMRTTSPATRDPRESKSDTSKTAGINDTQPFVSFPTTNTYVPPMTSNAPIPPTFPTAQGPAPSVPFSPASPPIPGARP